MFSKIVVLLFNFKNKTNKIFFQVKLLLLGAGESGKSTIAKQMKILYMEGYNVQERRNFVHIVFANIAQSLLTISNAMIFLGIRWAEDREDDMRIVMASAKMLSDFKVLI